MQCIYVCIAGIALNVEMRSHEISCKFYNQFFAHYFNIILSTHSKLCISQSNSMFVDLALEKFVKLTFSANLKAIITQLSFGILSQLWIH
jgi:hypothetical protein